MSGYEFKTIGFIGLGVMGEPMCRNLREKSGLEILAYDVNGDPLDRLASKGVFSCKSAEEVVRGSEVVFISLPSGEVVGQVAHASGGLLDNARPGQIFVDLSTSSVESTKSLSREFGGKKALFVDAPIARTRAAAEAGTLSVMVGADPVTFNKVKPLIATFAEEITLCGPVGSGQVLKILNNAILFQQVAILSEAKSIAEQCGVDSTVLFETLSKGSADSFALRNHGIKAVVPDKFPERAFSVKYAHKDLKYALQLAKAVGVKTAYAERVDRLFSKAIDQGLGELYWPVISRLVRE